MKIIVFILSLFAFSFSFANDEMEVESVSKNFLTLNINGESEKALSYFDEKSLVNDFGSKAKFIEKMSRASGDIQEKLGGLKEIKIDKVAIDPKKDKAFVALSIYYNKPFNKRPAETGYLFLVKKDGKWLIEHMDRG